MPPITGGWVISGNKNPRKDYLTLPCENKGSKEPNPSSKDTKDKLTILLPKKPGNDLTNIIVIKR